MQENVPKLFEGINVKNSGELALSKLIKTFRNEKYKIITFTRKCREDKD